MAGREETHWIHQEKIIQAQEWQTKYAGGKEITFEIGDQLWLSTRNLKTSRPSKELDYKHTRPYTVSNIISKNAYKLDLLIKMRNDNVFHVSLLKCYTVPVGGQSSSDPHRMIVEDTKEYRSTVYSTLAGAIGCCLIMSYGPVTSTSALGGSWPNTFKMPEIWLMSLTESVRICHGNRGLESVLDVQRTQKQFGLFILLCFFISFSSRLIGCWPSINAVGMGFPTNPWRLRLPDRRIRQKVTIERTDWMWDIWVHTNGYVGWLIHSLFPFLSFRLYTVFGSPGGLGIERRIM